ncbi:ADP-ribosylglycohydrolase family protein [Halothermothrix orenii]|uniref:ADP-ribosylation/Crystallin J1 n=1 Tax=Halothermothrix orenii (strain H 168 / OCM 544 / DSM 9562) TaxID=373903 RepID=B8D1Z6_HALOH|nr:ADP-ribosylglycohydrolase family protein [Halothermothrix orenii]ACL69223.1 ADP-ribosylation/Crystallin J1 [Halothermothrix orenii H 168]
MFNINEFKKDDDLKFDRALGAMIGLAIGDSFGDASRTEKNHKRFGITMDFDEGASWSTDDTEFALLTAHTLIEVQGNLTIESVKESWQKYVIPQDELYRGGSSEIEAAVNIKRGINPPESGRFNAYNISDGAAMRVTPIGIVCAGDPEKAARMAEVDACISHWRDGIWGAQAVAAAIAMAMVGASVDEIISAAYKVIPEDSWFKYAFKKALRIVESSNSIEEAWTPLHTELWSTYKAAVPEAISQAFALFKLSEGDFRKGVIYAGNFGRDADTIGAIVGALNGALNGAEEIPERWKEKTRYPTGTCLAFTEGMDVVKISKKLAELI